MGDEITDYKKFALPKPKATDGVAKGIVMRVDAFGNLITNFRIEDLPESALTNGEVKFQVGSQAVSRMVPTLCQRECRRTRSVRRLRGLRGNRAEQRKCFAYVEHRARYSGRTHQVTSSNRSCLPLQLFG